MAEAVGMGLTDVRAAIEWQADHAAAAGAASTARVVRAELAILDGETATGRRMANWQGLSLAEPAGARRAERDERRDIERAHADEARVAALAAEGQRPVALVVKRAFRHEAGARHDRQRLVEDAPLGYGEGQRFGHCGCADREHRRKGQRIWPTRLSWTSPT